MRRGRILLVVSFVGAGLAACSSSSSSNNSSDDGGGGGGSSGGASDDSSVGGGSSSGGIVNPFGDGGGLGMMATFNCHSPADCTEGGAGQACCFDISTMTASCAPSPCAMYTQCATNADCPGGGMCTPSPLSMTEHYCVGGGTSEGGTHEGGGSEAGTTEAGPEAGAETGTNDGATE
jgi:hypothetical protein